MNKRAISVVSIILMAFLCPFGVYASSIPVGNIKEDYTVLSDNTMSCFSYATSMSPQLASVEFNSSGGYTITASNNSTIGSSSYHFDNPNTHTTGSYLYGTVGSSTFYWPSHFDVTPTSGSNSQYNIVQYDILLNTSISNLTAECRQTNTFYYGMAIDYTIPNGVTICGSTVEVIDTIGLTLMEIGSTGNIYFMGDADHNINNHITVAPNSSIGCTIKLCIYGYYTGNYSSTALTLNTITLSRFESSSIYTGDNIPSTIYQLTTINRRLQSILDAYNSNVTASQNVTGDAQSSSNTIDNQHQQETNIYNQTNQAISDTGIQYFQFDGQTIGGLGGVKNDFMAVWNSLGTFNSIFITSLTIGLALSIVRHRRMFKQ